jgi:hypothetical protein
VSVLLWELTTNQRLFDGATEFEVFQQIVDRDAPAPSLFEGNYPARLEEIVLRGLRRDPAERYQTVKELQHDLEMFATEQRLTPSQTTLATLMADLFGRAPPPAEGDAGLAPTIPDCLADAKQSEPEPATATAAPRPRRVQPAAVAAPATSTRRRRARRWLPIGVLSLVVGLVLGLVISRALAPEAPRVARPARSLRAASPPPAVASPSDAPDEASEAPVAAEAVAAPVVRKSVRAPSGRRSSGRQPAVRRKPSKPARPDPPRSLDRVDPNALFPP